MLIPAGNLATSTLHKEPPAIRDTSTAHKGSSLMAGGGAMSLNFDTVKYHPIPFSAVKEMMRCNAASLMAGGGAVYLNFDTGHGEISSNPAISVEKDDEEQCGIPYGRWRCCLFEF